MFALVSFLRRELGCLVPAAATAACARVPLAGRARIDSRGVGCGWGTCSTRADPQFNRQRFATTAVDYRDASAVDTAIVHQVIHSARRSGSAFRITRAKHHVVGLCGRILL